MKNKILLFLSAFLLLVSCDDDYLKEKPLSIFTSDSFYTNDANLDQAAYGVYSTILYYWRNTGWTGSNIYPLAEVRCDDMALPTDGGAYSAFQPYDSFNYNASDGNIGGVWSEMYKGISRANVLIEKVTANAPGSGISESKKNTVLAEGYALRAYMYYILVRYWGDVPLTLSSIKSGNDENMYPGREKAAKVWEQIIKDLKTSIGEGDDPKIQLPVSAGGANSARLTLGSGYGILAEVCLTLKNWTDAAAYAKKAIDLNLYGLWPTYREVFLRANMGRTMPTDSKGRSNRIEGMWEMQFYNEIDPGTVVSVSCNPRGAYVWNFGSTFNSGDGTWCATKLLYDSFDANDGRRAHIFPDQYKNENGDWVDYPETTGVPGGRWMAKYTLEGQPLAVWGWAGNQVAVVRYPDILLIYAEAANELSGPTTEAYAAVNEVRQRANLSDLSGLGKDSFREAVSQERRKEFVFEGRRYFDLLRTGKVISENAKVGILVDPNKILLPIPQTELDANLNDTGFTQNPGYN